jgi:hypothetical protein
MLSGLVAATVAVSAGHAEEVDDTNAGSVRMPEVTVTADQAPGPFLPDVEQAKIYAGKKATIADLGKLPQVQANNYRQAYAQLPGLLTAEQTAPSHANFNYRGV